MQVLYVALYQILFLQRVPVFAAVDEAVKQVVRFRHRRHTGLINGLLRSVARCVSETVTAVPPLRPRSMRTITPV